MSIIEKKNMVQSLVEMLDTLKYQKCIATNLAKYF